MAKAEGRTYARDGIEAIDTGCLEVFDYKGAGEIITVTTTEFSAVCPFSGLPDIAKVTIRYVPRKRCIEFKSLKYYLLSFRNVGIYQEAVTKRIYNDLKKILKPEKLRVETAYNIRGGLDVLCEKGAI
ncbi:MAG: preQ(1) synthase [Candidatus Aureabacteria bacterium]|nr:preQ(1) synthase [Candidatus Auribacterota bacterium]